MLNFDPNFLKNGKLWFKYFGIFGKRLKNKTRHPKYAGQSTSTKNGGDRNLFHIF